MGSCNFLYLVLLVVSIFVVSSLFSVKCNAFQRDIDCLKSIRGSLEDPSNYVYSTWNFKNGTAGFICKFTGIQCWHDDENRVLSIALPGMNLSGEFPLGIQNCRDLTSLDLSGNELYGTIPSDISKIIGYVVTLDLSRNKFSGEIPADIANCSMLNNLKLDNNNLGGQIPPQIGLLGRLKTFDVSNNKLSGPVPNFINGTFPAESYANNLGLCGDPLPRCKVPRQPKLDHHTVEFISGFVTGWSLFTLLGIYLFAFGFPSLNKILNKRKKVTGLPNGSRSPQVNNNRKISKLEKFVTRMSYVELAEATSNFSQDSEIGNGMLGKVYKALVPNGWTVAIKRLHDSEDLEQEFVSEITTLGSLRHQNLLPLIGFSRERDERLLVYKYMPHGNLHEWLHSSDDKASLLDFPLRLKIAVGVAKALAWLHHGGNFRVVHSNISTQCIFLDENFDPKISNFWEATVEKPDMDPEDKSMNVLPIVESIDFTSYKSDVYRFGVVLLELLTRKESYQLNCCSRIDLSSSSFASLLDVDKVLLGQGFDAMVLQLLELASNCMKFIPDQRPTMQQVYQTLAVIARTPDLIGYTEIQLQFD